MNLRNHEQIMGYWLNEPAILNHQHIVDTMTDLGTSGYGIVRIMLRHTCFHHRSPEVIAAVAVAVEHGHKNGLRVVFDCEPHDMVADELGKGAPEAIGLRVFRGEGPVRNGGFSVDFQLSSGSITFDHVVETVLNDGIVQKPIAVPEYNLVWETNMSELGITDQRQVYSEGKPLQRSRHIRMSGNLETDCNGKIVFYIAVIDRTLVDFAAPGTKAWYRGLVDDYSHIPLDGICWDEPAIAGNWNSYRYGHSFAKSFAESNGYELASCMHLLDTPGLLPDAVKVRLDYYRTLNETMFEAQADMIAAARDAFGQDILLGTHHTWQGEGGINDYRAGAVDYFRLNDQMDAGYTDCCWWDPASVAYSYALGSSLGRLTPSGECECNTWNWKPTVRSTKWNGRLMSLMDITWFNIWYGDDCDTTMFPAHYAWAAQVEAMQDHKRWQKFLGYAKPIVDIAVLHDWQCVCGANSTHVTSLHKAFCMNLSLNAQSRSVAFDFVDSRLLAESTVKDGLLCNTLGSYRVLVLPSAVVLDRDAWKSIEAFVSDGGQVIFAGMPPSVDADGLDLTVQFAALLDIKPLHADEYDSWFRQTGAPMPQNRPDRFDLAYPLAVDSTRAILSTEGDVCGVFSKDGNVIWFSGYEASEAVLGELCSCVPRKVNCFSSTVLWRLYRGESSTFLMMISREDEELSGIMEYAGWQLRLAGGTCACLELDADGTAKLHQEEETESESILTRI